MLNKIELLMLHNLCHRNVYKFKKKKPHASSWKMCANCVIQLPVIIAQPAMVSANDNEPLQAPTEVPVIAIDVVTTDTTANLSTNDSGLSDNTSQVILLTKSKLTNAEVHLDSNA